MNRISCNYSFNTRSITKTNLQFSLFNNGGSKETKEENLPFFFLFRFLLAKIVAIRRATPTIAATMSHTTAGCITAILVSFDSPMAMVIEWKKLGVERGNASRFCPLLHAGSIVIACERAVLIEKEQFNNLYTTESLFGSVLVNYGNIFQASFVILHILYLTTARHVTSLKMNFRILCP